MASAMSQQYAFRSQKSLGLVGGSPDYETVKGFEAPEATARTYTYSPDGRLFAYLLPNCVRIHYAESAELLRELPFPNIIEISFSPRGTYISTWERVVKLENDAQHKNLRVFSVSSGEELASFTQKAQSGWELQFTISESHAVRLVGQEIQVFHPADWSKGVVDKVRLEGVSAISLSPGLNPFIAVFIAGKNGQPANIRVYSLLTLSGSHTCSKTTFRADNAQFKWNTIGTQVLALVRTDVDQTNKSYYGESRLYLLSSSGTFDCQVTTTKEGPIHDFAWSPNSKEFGVVCGYTPMSAVLFDSRVKIIHDFGTAPQNFISFNPQGRLIALAGFGNMSGKINVYDRRSCEKIAEVDAPNTTFFEWSPCGRFMFTATLSPRLRVDNGIKIWHCSGPLMHVQLIDELYQASWRPIPVDSVGAFPQAIPPAPSPSPSVALFNAGAKPISSKPMGTYRPPGARGLEASSVYKREDSEPNSGANTPNRPHNRSPGPGANGYGGPGSGRGRGRYVPGAAPASPTPARGGGAKKHTRTKRNKADKKQDGKAEKEPSGEAENEPSGEATPLDGAEGEEQLPQATVTELQAAAAAVVENAGATQDAPVVDDNALEALSKQMRNLRKKLKAIDDLKDRQNKGERLEDTQVKKIGTESDIRRKLDDLSLQSGIPVGS
ncbi:translation initiation factor eIF-2A [Fomitiporia mediterranea MF3/22]|uniref:translation initiation factor eIF-2A n=1 Tax=Fomitiporia mediterranea (strain MF3/22) TaxID=694068 RepID=UPI000440880F|nr:translation initiation factor eIF-2A [Fomitiporia mediterranea MF3/22]EJD06210.1 translation initiation factor eIF-2A [Fomitiporia mediterranea MF3/22]